MSNVNKILMCLANVKEAGHNKWSALCPAHDDNTPSLSISTGNNGKILLHCHAGCAYSKILSAINMTQRDLFADNPTSVTECNLTQQIQPKTSGHVIAKYDYVNESGELLYQVVRYCPKDFRQRKPDGNGSWIWKTSDIPKILYNLPRLLAAEAAEPIFLVEGEKDVHSLSELDLIASCNPGGAGKWNNLSDYSPLLNRRVTVIPDNDETGQQHAKSIAESIADKVLEVKILKLEGLPPKGDISDWILLQRKSGRTDEVIKDELLKLSDRANTFDLDSIDIRESGWPDPMPLPDQMLPVQDFDPTLLPSTLRPWIVDIAERMQCPLDFPAVTAMIGLSGILGRKLAIRPKQMDNWTVYPNLWGMLIGRPSLMKSPPMKETLMPIRQMTSDAIAEYDAQASEQQANAELYSIKAKLIKDKIAQALKAGEDIECLQCELQKYLKPQQSTRKRYTVNDTTVEALGQILSENPNGVIMERDELMGFLKSLERNGQEGARAFYLEAWTGDGSFETDRIGRGNVRIDGVCLSIIGTIQPGPLSMYLNEALQGGAGDDGLMQRFQLAVWPNDPGTWKVVDRHPDAEAKATAYEVYRRFDKLTATDLGEMPGAFDINVTPYMRLDTDAQKLFFEWMLSRENELRKGTEHVAIESHKTKYRKLIPAIALIIHLAENRSGPVCIDALERAIRWGDYLESHARRIYSCGIDSATTHASALVHKIRSGEVTDGFTLREVYHGNHWSMLADASQVRIAVDELINLGWLRAEEIRSTGRPTTKHYINPKTTGMAL